MAWKSIALAGPLVLAAAAAALAGGPGGVKGHVGGRQVGVPPFGKPHFNSPHVGGFSRTGYYRPALPYNSANTPSPSPTNRFRNGYTYPNDFGRPAPYRYTPNYDLLWGGAGYFPLNLDRDPPPARKDSRAHLTVNVPAGAEIWVNGSRTGSTGQVREFQSPPLAPEGKFSYEIKARWRENGQEVTQTQTVSVWAGANLKVEFPTKDGGDGRDGAAREK